MRTLTLAKSTNNFDFVPVTGWWPVALINTARVLYGNESGSPTGTLYQMVGLQLAGARVDMPDDWSTQGTQISQNSYTRVDLNMATLRSTNKFWCRFGYAVRVRYDDNVVVGQYYTQIDTDKCGRLVPARTLTLRPISNSPSRFTPVTDWTPAVGMTGVTAAFIVTSWLTNLQYRLCYRTRNDSVEAGVSVGGTTAWTSIGSLTTPGAVNTDQVVVQALTTSDQEIQFGIEWAGTSGQADVTVAVAIQH